MDLDSRFRTEVVPELVEHLGFKFVAAPGPFPCGPGESVHGALSRNGDTYFVVAKLDAGGEATGTRTFSVALALPGERFYVYLGDYDPARPPGQQFKFSGDLAPQ